MKQQKLFLTPWCAAIEQTTMLVDGCNAEVCKVRDGRHSNSSDHEVHSSCASAESGWLFCN